jgi:hypothetical protein
MLTFLRDRTLTQWILVAMVLGTLVGYLVPDSAQELKPLSTIFLRMIKSLIAPALLRHPRHRHRWPRGRHEAWVQKGTWPRPLFLHVFLPDSFRRLMVANTSGPRRPGLHQRQAR